MDGGVYEGGTLWREITYEGNTKGYQNSSNILFRCRRELEFDINDLISLKVSPMKGVICFGKKGKEQGYRDKQQEIEASI